MASLNKTLLMGNLTRDPELRVTPGGLSVLNIGLAVNRKFSDKDGNQKEEVTFIDLTAFGKQAEILNQYCQKGSPLFVEGRLKVDQWQDKQSGQNRTKMGVVIESFQFLGQANSAGGTRPATPPNRSQSGPPASYSENGYDPGEDVPF